MALSSSLLPLPPPPSLSSSLPLSLLPLLLLLYVAVRSGIRTLGQLPIWQHHFPSAVLRILLAADNNNSRNIDEDRSLMPLLSALLSAAIVNHMLIVSTR
jgi:hypothetical protein